jgi:hypothetical protein
MSSIFDIYQFTHPNGSSKIWAVRFDSEEVVICFGKNDRVNQTRKVPIAKCPAGTAAEAEKRAQGKLSEGYVYLGEGTLDRGKVIIQNTASKPQTYYWEFDGGGMSDGDFALVLEDAKQAIRSISRHSGWGVHVRDNGFYYEHDFHRFQLLFEDNAKDGVMSFKDKRGQGTIPPEMRTFQGLFFLRLSAIYGSRLTIANESGAELDLSNGLWPLPELFGPVPEEWVMLAAEELELKPVAIKFEKIKDTSLGEWFY